MQPSRILPCLLFLASVAAAEPDLSAPRYPALSAKAEASLDARWRKIQEKRPEDSSRDIYEFILSAAAAGWRPQTLPQVIALAEELHERDPKDKGYGNYRWYWHDQHPDDMNAGEFCMQTASLTWNLYRDHLTPESRKALEAALRFGAVGITRHKVEVSYTNIFLMRLSNAILIGQSTDQPELVKQGEAWLDEWLAYTKANGVHEFSSPTYYAVDLADLACLARYAQDASIRAKAQKIGIFFWTDIAANWFVPHQGISGAYSRDYGFLIGHGYLDQQFMRAGWIKDTVPTEARPTLDDATFLPPPAGIRDLWGDSPRRVARQYGPKPVDRASNYVGRTFSLGSAGESYNAQDRMVALTFDGGPKEPIGSFSFDYRNDPYGQGKIKTSGGHSKLTHLVPFIGSVQHGPEVLEVGWIDPAKTPNPAGKNQSMTWEGVTATFVLPRSVEIWDGPTRVGDAGDHAFAPDAVIFVRKGRTAAALRFLAQANTDGEAPFTQLVRDGDALGAERLSVALANGKPSRRVSAGLWIRAEENLDDAKFAAFQEAMIRDGANASVVQAGDLVTATVPGLKGPLAIEADPKKQEVKRVRGEESSSAHGILVVNGRDYGSLLP